MVEFDFVAKKNMLGRDAAWIVYKTMNESVTIVIEAEGRSTATEYYKELRIMTLLSLGIREGSHVYVSVEGENEEVISKWLEQELKSRL